MFSFIQSQNCMKSLNCYRKFYLAFKCLFLRTNNWSVQCSFGTLFLFETILSESSEELLWLIQQNYVVWRISNWMLFEVVIRQIGVVSQISHCNYIFLYLIMCLLELGAFDAFFVVLVITQKLLFNVHTTFSYCDKLRFNSNEIYELC